MLSLVIFNEKRSSNMATIAEHAVFHSQANEQERAETEVSCYECTNCFHVSEQCLIDVCPHCGESLVERNLRPSELLETPESHGCRLITKEDETVFQHHSKFA